jgi:Uma2 family endonuclease
MFTQIPPIAEVTYPDSDGNPMAENTEHFELIFWIEKNLELIFADQPEVFVAGDLLWYPIDGNNVIRQAPDVMVAFNRPKGYRGSYKQWIEGNIPPQVVFEILSPGNRWGEMTRKFAFYQRYGVEEYYVYNPRQPEINGWQVMEGILEEIPDLQNWISPRLGIRFEITETGLQLYHPDDRPFVGFLELDQQLQLAESRAQTAESRAQTAESRAQTAEERIQATENLLEQERQRSQALLDRLKSLGINPESNE